MIMVIHFLQRKHIVPNLQVATVLSCGHEVPAQPRTL